MAKRRASIKDEEILELMRQGLHNAEICRRLSMDQTAANPKLKRLREENGLVRFRRGEVVKSDRGTFEIVNSCANDFTIRSAAGQVWIVPWTKAGEYKVISGPLIEDDIPGPDYRIEGVRHTQERILEPKQVICPDPVEPEPIQDIPEPMIDVDFVLDEIESTMSPFETMRFGIRAYLGSLIVEGKPLKQRYVDFYNELTQEVNE